MKEGKAVGSGEKDGMENGKEGVESGKEDAVESGKKDGVESGKNVSSSHNKTAQPINVGKEETKRQPPVDANGKPVSVDHHWKEFMKKSGKSGKSQKRKEERKEEKGKRAKTFFDDDSETVGTKKVPLRSKSVVCLDRIYEQTHQ